jgi:hypothetical protein
MAAFLDSFEKSEGLDLLIGRWNPDYDDPDSFTHTLFHSKAGHYRSWFSSEAADHLLEEARSESRPAVREALYRKFESLLVEANALIPLFHDVDYRLASPKVRGLTARKGRGSSRGSPPSAEPRKAGRATVSACATTSASTTAGGSARATCATRSSGCCNPAASPAGSSRRSAAPAPS